MKKLRYSYRYGADKDGFCTTEKDNVVIIKTGFKYGVYDSNDELIKDMAIWNGKEVESTFEYYLSPDDIVHNASQGKVEVSV